MLNLTSEVLGCVVHEFHSNWRAEQAAPLCKKVLAILEKNEGPGEKRPRRLTYSLHNLEKRNCHLYPSSQQSQVLKGPTIHILGFQGWLFVKPWGNSPPHHQLGNSLAFAARRCAQEAAAWATWQLQVLCVRCHGDGPRGWWRESNLPKLLRFRKETEASGPSG